MTLPATVRTAVSPETLAKVTRLFNGTAGDVLAELLQNARRAGASRVHVTAHRVRDGFAHHLDDALGRGGALWLTVADDGRGVADLAALLTLGRSGWEPETRRAEDPAGMGLFALAGRPVRVASNGDAGAWEVAVPADAWTSGAELAVAPARRPATRGTRVSVEVPEAWAASLKFEVQRAARHYPLPVSFDGLEVPRASFLAEALHIEAWRGLRLGVVRQHRASAEPRVNFHGVTVPCRLPQVAEARGPTFAVLVDVVDCPELSLVLPARKEVVATPFLDELREAGERAIYRFFAARRRHDLPFESWRRAAALGVALPPAAAELRPWAPVTNDGDLDTAFRDRAGPAALPDEPLVMAKVGADLGQSLARAIECGAPELKDRLVEAEGGYEGYPWYDALPRVTDVVGAIVRGGNDWATDAEDPRPPSGPVDRIWVALTVEGRDGTAVRPLDTDLLLVAGEDAWGDDPDEQGVFVAAGSGLAPAALADRIVAAFFSASDDRDADSWETQAGCYAAQALDLARRLLLGDEEASLARLRDAVREHLAWLVPHGRQLRVRYDAEGLDVALETLADEAHATPPGAP